MLSIFFRNVNYRKLYVFEVADEVLYLIYWEKTSCAVPMFRCGVVMMTTLNHAVEEYSRSLFPSEEEEYRRILLEEEQEEEYSRSLFPSEEEG